MKTPIKNIQFGILSDEDINRLSVCEVNNTRLCGMGSIYDARMGVLDHKLLCSSCGKNNKECPGHFGHISLSIKILHPLLYKYIHSLLKCVCFSCSRCLISKEQLELNGISHDTSRFNRVKELCEKVNICYHCSEYKPKIIYSTTENIFQSTIKEGNSLVKTDITDEEVKTVFDNMLEEDIILLGLNPKYSNPSNLIMTKLMVLPPVARPYVIVDNMTCDDDLTV